MRTGPRHLDRFDTMLRAIRSGHSAGYDRFKPHRIQMPPSPLVTMVFHSTLGTTVRTRNRMIIWPVNFNDHSLLIHLQINRTDTPRRNQSQQHPIMLMQILRSFHPPKKLYFLPPVNLFHTKVGRNKKKGLLILIRSPKNPATSYSPTRDTLQYHRR